MHYSGYQIEALLKQFRRFQGLWASIGRAPRPRGDPVTITEAGRNLARSRWEQDGSGWLSASTTGDVTDRHRRPEPVERELERRAASFLPPEESEDAEENGRTN